MRHGTIDRNVKELMGWQGASLFQPIKGQRKPWAIKFQRDGKTYQTGEATKTAWTLAIDVLEAAANIHAKKVKELQSQVHETLADYSNEDLQAEVLRRLGHGSRYERDVTWPHADFSEAFGEYFAPDDKQLVEIVRGNTLTMSEVFPDEYDDLRSEVENEVLRTSARVAYAEGDELAEAIRDLRHELACRCNVTNKLAAKLL